MSKSKKEGGKNRKIGRSTRSKAMARYKAENRSERNKEKKIKRHTKRSGDVSSHKQPHDFPIVPKNDGQARSIMTHDVGANYAGHTIFIVKGAGKEVERTVVRDEADKAYDKLDVEAVMLKQAPDGTITKVKDKRTNKGNTKLGDKLMEFVKREELRQIRRAERKAQRSKEVKKEDPRIAAVNMRLVNPRKTEKAA